MVKTADFESAYQCSNHCLGTKLFLFMKHKKHAVFSNYEIKAHYKLIKLLKNNIICPKCKKCVNIKTHKNFKYGDNSRILTFFDKEAKLKGLSACKCKYTSFNEFEKSLTIDLQISNKVITISYMPVPKVYRIYIGVLSSNYENYVYFNDILYENNLYVDPYYQYKYKFDFNKIKNILNKMLLFIYKLEMNEIFL